MPLVTVNVSLRLTPEGIGVMPAEGPGGSMDVLSYRWAQADLRLRMAAGNLSEMDALDIATALERIVRDIRNSIEADHAQKDWSE